MSVGSGKRKKTYPPRFSERKRKEGNRVIGTRVRRNDKRRYVYEGVESMKERTRVNMKYTIYGRITFE